MKNIKWIFVLFLSFMVVSCSSKNEEEKEVTLFKEGKKVENEKLYLAIVEELSPTFEFYMLNKGEFTNCVEYKVNRPCDTDWVQCVEDAVAVEILAGDKCGIKHDGRLSLKYLVDKKDLTIKSFFPEEDYFRYPLNCLEDYDCLESNGQCLNFIHAQIQGDPLEHEECLCQSGVCQFK